MKDFRLMPEQLQELRLEHRKTRDKRAAYRLNAIWLLGSGWSQKEVCEALLLDEGTLSNYVSRYREGSIKELVQDHYVGGQAKLSAQEKQQLDEHLQQTTYLNAKSVNEYIRKTFKKDYDDRSVIELLKRLGYTYKKPKIIPGEAQAEAQKEFIADYYRLKSKLCKGEKILFMDGVHPQHNITAGYGWIKKGKEKLIKSNTGRQRLNINGTIDIESFEVTVSFDEILSASSVERMLKKIRMQYQRSGRIYLICDNARYYRAKSVKKEATKQNIKFVLLPPYSPNLNLIERLWKFFRKKVLYNQYYEKFSDFKQPVSNFFQRVKNYTSELQSLLTENFQIIGQT